jgi:hypothetical protein
MLAHRIAFSAFDLQTQNVVLNLAARNETKWTGSPFAQPNGGIIGSGQVAAAPDGSALSYCSFCETCSPQGWNLEVFDLRKQKSHVVATALQGGAGLAGQPAWSSDATAVAFVGEASREDEGGSWWDVNVANLTTGKTRAIDTVWTPAIGTDEFKVSATGPNRPNRLFALSRHLRISLPA